MTQLSLPGLPVYATPPLVYLHHHLSPEDAVAEDERLLAQRLASLSSEIDGLEMAVSLAHDDATRAALAQAVNGVRSAMRAIMRGMGRLVS